MPNLNRIVIMGHCGKDPETRYTQSGKQCTTVSIATNYKWKDQDGKEQTKAELHRVVAWGKTAEIIAEQFRKGDGVYVEGRLQYRDGEDDQGVKRTAAEIVAFMAVKCAPSPQDGRRGNRQSPPPPEDDIPF